MDLMTLITIGFSQTPVERMLPDTNLSTVRDLIQILVEIPGVVITKWNTTEENTSSWIENRIPWSFAVFTHLSGCMEGNFDTSSIFIWRFSANGIFGSFSTWALESWIFSLMNSSERFWWSLTEVSFLTMNVNKNKTKRKMTNFLSLH